MVQKQKIGEGFVEFSAKLDRYIRDLKKAEQLAKKSGKKSGNLFGAGVKGATDRLASAVTAAGKIEAGLKGAAGVAKLLRGDFEGAAKAFESLPFGIGPVVTGLKSILGEITGINKEMEEFEKRNKKINAEFQGRVRFQTKRGTRETRFTNLALQLERQAQLTGATTSADKAALQRKFQRRDIESQIEGAGSTLSRAVTTKVLRALSRLEFAQGAAGNQTVQRMADPTSRTISASRFAFTADTNQRREPTEDQIDTLIELTRQLVQSRGGARVN